MAKQLFGTDGIRGVAGKPPLDSATIYACGVALGKDLQLRAVASSGAMPVVVMGMDTRESGPSIAALLAGGLMATGTRVRFAGVLTTPGVAYLARSAAFSAGVMISASHNPYLDNGIKIFASTGYKLPDDEEHSIEEEIFRLLAAGVTPEPHALEAETGLTGLYVEYLLSIQNTSLAGMRVVLDCGNGAASHLAPELFRRAGATVLTMGNEPDGRNINLNCGALHVEGLRDRVLLEKADAGVAFDGDADRAILVSSSGRTVDGDAVLLIAAEAMQQAGHLAGDSVVATVMSNLGLERALNALNVSMTRMPVGDKYVLEEMLRTGAALGGEQSGHVIFREFSTTGDGMLTALRIFEIAQATGKGLDRLTQGLQIYPQRLVNVRFTQRRDLAQMPAVQEAIGRCEMAFGPAGRVLVRFSGTEPLARVMVEGPDLAAVEQHAAEIAEAIRVGLS